MTLFFARLDVEAMMQADIGTFLSWSHMPMPTPPASPQREQPACEQIEDHGATRGLLYATLLGVLFWSMALGAWNLV